MSQASTAKPVTRDTNSNPSGLIDLGSSAPAGLRPVRINAAGQVVGTIGSTDPGKIGLPIAGYVYSGGSVTTIGTLGGTISSARAINANGLIVGDATVAGTNEPHAFLDSNSQLTDLGTLGGTFSVATAINSSGLITGYADLPSQSNPPTLPPIEHAFLYSQGQMTDIGTLPGYAQCVPTDINDNAVIAGTAYLVPGGPDTRQLAGFVYSNGTMQDLGTLGGLWTAAYAINNAGQVVGMSTTGPLIGKNAKGQIHAYL